METHHRWNERNGAEHMIPYGKQSIGKEDIKAVEQVLRSDWLTTGPKVSQFEEAFAKAVGTKFAVAVSSGTAALHATMYALGISPDDEVIVSPMTFAASANCVVFQGGKPVFADVNPDTLLIDPNEVAARITSHTKAIIAVDYAGQACDYDELRKITDRHNLALVDDACHALGGSYKGRPVGLLADLNTFSFHPVKLITTGEGGMITTNDSELVKRMRTFRNHGITTDHTQRMDQGTWYYEMVDLGYNYRLTDFQCALGMSQLSKLSGWVKQRQEIAHQYDHAFTRIPEISPLAMRPNVIHAYHLYVIRLELERLKANRAQVFAELREKGIGVNVHYIPVHLHPYYQKHFGTKPGDCPVAESAYERILSLPIFPTMTDSNVDHVIDALCKVVNQYS